MANELTEIKENTVAVIESHDLGDIIKPLIREIHLFDSYVAGTTHLEDTSVLDEIKEGDMLSLQREDNKFDSNAVMILLDGKKTRICPGKRQHHLCEAYGCRKDAEGKDHQNTE